MHKQRPHQKDNLNPPVWATKFLRWYCNPAYQDEIEGDLLELYERRVKTIGKTQANLLYILNILSFIRAYTLSRRNKSFTTNHLTMFRNYFKIAIRSLSKNQFFSAIHILGLAIGIAACLLILQYVNFERSYDQYHENASDIYRVPIEYSEGFSDIPKLASNHPALGPALKKDFPEVKEFARVVKHSIFVQDPVFSYRDSTGRDVTSSGDKLYLADSSFLPIFSLPFIAGDPSTALSKPLSIVISASTARKYFGNENPIGKSLIGNGIDPLQVTGVFEDVPSNSHIKFDILLSFITLGNIDAIWVWPEYYTYVLLEPGTDPKQLEAKFPAFIDRYMTEIHKEHKFQSYFSLQPITDIHLKSDCGNEPEVHGKGRIVYFLTLIAIFILLIAWINYVNLSTSKSIERAQEVGVRKVAGASRTQLVWQFLLEAVMINGLGTVLGVLLASTFLPYFGRLTGTDIGKSLFETGLLTNVVFWISLVAAILVGGLLSGFYPALVLSSFRPVNVLKGKLHQSSSGILFRKLLVGFQFIVSIVLIAGTLTVLQQLAFMTKQDLGYNKDQILVVKAPVYTDSSSFRRVSVLKSEIRQSPRVNQISGSSEIPGNLIVAHNGMRKLGQEKDANVTSYMKQIDPEYFSTLQVPIVAGRNFVETDSSVIFGVEDNKVMINEALAKMFQFENLEEALGQKIIFKYGPREHQATIIGVAKNYHQRSLEEDYDPIMYLYYTYATWNYLSINIQMDNIGESIAMIEENYKALFPKNPFEYFFLDEYFDQQYRSDQQFGKVFKLLSGLAIFVACLGFLGLSTLILTQRTKEIGIRKILGASISGILYLISKDFVKLLVIANLISIPLIIYMARNWLNNFAFHINLNWMIFLIPTALLLAIVMIIVGIQTYRTATLNPIHSLRDE